MFRDNVNFMTYMFAVVQMAYTLHFYPPKMEGGVSTLLLPRLITDFTEQRKWKALQLPNVNNNTSRSVVL